MGIGIGHDFGHDTKEVIPYYWDEGPFWDAFLPRQPHRIQCSRGVNMPAYDYRCSRCGITEQRIVPFDLRDAQVCDRQIGTSTKYSYSQQQEIPCGLYCNVLLERLPHYSQVQVQIPVGFHTNQAELRKPQNDEVRETWDRDGVGSARWV